VHAAAFEQLAAGLGRARQPECGWKPTLVGNKANVLDRHPASRSRATHMWHCCEGERTELTPKPWPPWVISSFPPVEPAVELVVQPPP